MSKKKVLISIILFALLLRLIFGIAYFRRFGTERFIDDWDYISYARNILEQGIFVPDISGFYSSSHLVGPGFPMVLALVFAVFGVSYLPVIVLNAVISALICAVIFLLGRELFDERTGLYAAVWSSVYILYIWFVPCVLKEVWMALLFPLLIYAFILETKREGISAKSLFHIVIFAFLIHVDERFFVFFPLLAVFSVILDKVGWRNGVKKATLFVALVIVLMIPWLVRNYYVYGKPVILTERTTVFTDPIFGYGDEKSEYIKTEERRSEFSLTGDQIDSLLSGEDVAGLGGRMKEDLVLGLKSGLIPRRYGTLERWRAEFTEFWRPFRFSGGYVGNGYRYEGPWSMRHNLSLMISYGLLLPFFVLGVVLLIRNRHRAGMFIVCVMLVHTAIHVILTHARNRYRISVDAFVIVIAFYGVTELVRFFAAGSRRRSFLRTS